MGGWVGGWVEGGEREEEEKQTALLKCATNISINGYGA